MKVSPLTVGPIIGATTSENTRIWGRGEYEPTSNGPRRCFGVARIRDKSTSNYGPPTFFKLNPNFDMTGLACFTDLHPETEYRYQVGWFFADRELEELGPSFPLDWSHAQTGEFRSGSDDPKRERSFVVGSCRYLLRLFGGSWFDNRGDKSFLSVMRQMEKNQRTDQLLMVGDQIYADDLNILKSDEAIDEFNRRYREAFTRPHLRDLMSRVPTYMTLDDHEIEDNWPAKATEKDLVTKYPAAVHSYLSYQLSHSPLFQINKDKKITGVPDRLWYSFADGCCDFFVMDTRTERHLHAIPEQATIVNSIQFDALKKWLDDGSGRVKFVASAVPLFPDSNPPGSDKWSGFLKQRTELLDFIKKRGIKRVVFLSGDVHCSMSAELTAPDDPGFQIVSVISSSFFWPYPHPNRDKFQMSGPLVSLAGAKYTVGNAGNFHGTDNFTRVSANPDGITVEVFSRKGKKLGTNTHAFKL